jgi:hypothetical protein
MSGANRATTIPASKHEPISPEPSRAAGTCNRTRGEERGRALPERRASSAVEGRALQAHQSRIWWERLVKISQLRRTYTPD